MIEVVSKTASREDDFEVTVYDKYNNPMRYLKGSSDRWMVKIPIR